MVSFTTLLAFSAAALASPLRTRQIEIPEGWTWQVTNWSAGCARSCYYDFNVTVPTIEGQIGGVKAYCSGGEDAWYRNCRILEGVNNGVSAKLSERNGSGSPAEIQLSFELVGYEER